MKFSFRWSAFNRQAFHQEDHHLICCPCRLFLVLGCLLKKKKIKPEDDVVKRKE